MGKSQKKRAMRRHNPMRVPDSHLSPGLAAAAESSKNREQILPILQKMESVDGSERKWACVAVSNIIQNDPSTRRLLQGKNVVGSLITRLSDSEEEVVVEAAGALRNLCVDGGYDICGEMYNKNILVPLKSFVPKIADTLAKYLENPKSAPENAQKVVYELAENVITIFWCLSETSHKALTMINQANLIPFLLSFLAHRDKLPLSTVASAAQCLYVLTDDNQPAINEIRLNSSYTFCLITIAQEVKIYSTKDKNDADENAMTLRVLSSGILQNISPLLPVLSTVDLEREVILPLLSPLITHVSLEDATHRVQALVSQQDSNPQLEKLSIKKSQKVDHRSTEELELGRIEKKLRTVQLGLEILTQVCATLPDPESTTGDEPGEDDGGAVMDVEEDSDVDMDQADSMPIINKSVAHNLLQNLVHPLLSLIIPTSLSFAPGTSPSPHPPTTSVLTSIHICAFECLNNIFFSLSNSPRVSLHFDLESGRRAWQVVWSSLRSIGEPTKGGSADGTRQTLWQIGVGVLWGISILHKGSIVPEEEQVQTLMNISDGAGKDDNVRVKCIGTLECLAQHPESVNVNRVVANYLISLLPTAANTKAPIELTLQAVSALIDIYSDETVSYDVNFRERGFLDSLVESVEGVRKIVRSINRKERGGLELRRRGEEVRDNLIDFIAYRRSLTV